MPQLEVVDNMGKVCVRRLEQDIICRRPLNLLGADHIYRILTIHNSHCNTADGFFPEGNPELRAFGQFIPRKGDLQSQRLIGTAHIAHAYGDRITGHIIPRGLYAIKTSRFQVPLRCHCSQRLNYTFIRVLRRAWSRRRTDLQNLELQYTLI